MGNETWLAPIAGGALIGLAAVLLMLSLGRIAGVAGILGGLLSGGSEGIGWRGAFIAGLVLGPWAIVLFGAPLPAIHIDATLPVVVVAGFLVGFGSRLGNGCTSGHGVCGLARLSPRSLAATGVFMAVAMVVVFVIRHVFGG
jgi:hypothetical protein